MGNLNITIPVEGFDWDKGNRFKNEDKHDVTCEECEQVFLNHHYVGFDDKHSTPKDEDRYFMLGSTNESRGLYVVWTLRRNKVRIISARDMNRKERLWYEQLQKNT